MACPATRTTARVSFSAHPPRSISALRPHLRHAFRIACNACRATPTLWPLACTVCAWYVLSSIGIYQVCPGNVAYTIGSPLFCRAALHTDGRPSAVIEAPDNSEASVYVHLASSSLDGTPLDRSWVTYDELISGATLRLSMAPTPEENATALRHWPAATEVQQPEMRELHCPLCCESFVCRSEAECGAHIASCSAFRLEFGPSAARAGLVAGFDAATAAAGPEPERARVEPAGNDLIDMYAAALVPLVPLDSAADEAAAMIAHLASALASSVNECTADDGLGFGVEEVRWPLGTCASPWSLLLTGRVCLCAAGRGDDWPVFDGARRRARQVGADGRHHGARGIGERIGRNGRRRGSSLLVAPTSYLESDGHMTCMWYYPPCSDFS